MHGGSAREVALLALSACEQQGAWSDGYLKRAIGDAGLDGRDAAFATRLCFGVLQNKLLMDHYINQLSSVKTDKLENRVLNALRLGAYQMLLLDRIPHSAAVNESVNLVRKYAKNPRAAGLVNGVLRTLSRTAEKLPQPTDISIRFSHPEWLVKDFRFALNDIDLEGLLEANNAHPPTVAQVNTCRTTAKALCDELMSCGVSVECHSWLKDCLILSDTGNIEQLPAFQEGKFYIQDVAARLSVLAIEPQPGMRILDACAAPGGKSFAAGILMSNQGEIVSCDIHPHKQALIQAGADRLGLDIIHPRIMDGKRQEESFLSSFDCVIADVPCSGLGIIRKKPDIRYKDPKLLQQLPAVQRAVLENVSNYVKPGGVLLYATCTVMEHENSDVVSSFLDKRNDFTLENFTVPGPFGTISAGKMTLWPHIHGTDGFFFAKLRKI